MAGPAASAGRTREMLKLALLEPLQLKLILDGACGQAGDDVIQVSVLEMQLVDTLPEHFAVGRMYHG